MLVVGDKAMLMPIGPSCGWPDGLYVSEFLMALVTCRRITHYQPVTPPTHPTNTSSRRQKQCCLLQSHRHCLYSCPTDSFLQTKKDVQPEQKETLLFTSADNVNQLYSSTHKSICFISIIHRGQLPLESSPRDVVFVCFKLAQDR